MNKEEKKAFEKEWKRHVKQQDIEDENNPESPAYVDFRAGWQAYKRAERQWSKKFTPLA